MDLRSRRLAFNSKDSQSGYVGPLDYAKRHGVALMPSLETGAHWASGIAVVEGNADVAAIDAITWRQMRAFDGFTDDLRVIGKTDSVPGLPLITGQKAQTSLIREAVVAVLADQPAAAKPLGIIGLSDLRAEDYIEVAFTIKPDR